jgi:hypothetical protein
MAATKARIVTASRHALVRIMAALAAIAIAAVAAAQVPAVRQLARQTPEP